MGLRLYQGLMDQLGMVPWPRDRVQLGHNLARFVVHLAAKRSLQVSTICSYLARVHLELLDRGLDPQLTASKQLRILLTVVERNVGKAQHRKQPITTALLCQFAILLTTAPVEVQLAWGPIVIGVWLLLHLGEIVPTSIFDPLRHLTTGAVSIYFPRSATPLATGQLRQSKMDPAGWGAVVSMACVCLKVPPSVCPVHTLLATL